MPTRNLCGEKPAGCRRSQSATASSGFALPALSVSISFLRDRFFERATATDNAAADWERLFERAKATDEAAADWERFFEQAKANDEVAADWERFFEQAKANDEAAADWERFFEQAKRTRRGCS